MCGTFPVDIPVTDNRITQVTTIPIPNTPFFVETPTPITVAGSLSVSGADAIYLPTFAAAKTITNTGSITASTTGYYGIKNLASITALTNSQGGDSLTPATTALTYTGNLATNYSIVIYSPTHYGQLVLANPTSTGFNFGIDPTSVVTAGTYLDVLQGFSNINILTGATGSFASGTYTYSLEFDVNDGAANNWNLVVTSSGGAVPEIDGALIPQVGFLIACLFLILGRRKDTAVEKVILSTPGLTI